MIGLMQTSTQRAYGMAEVWDLIAGSHPKNSTRRNNAVLKRDEWLRRAALLAAGAGE